jgi:cell division protein FtsI (penicillin-binding protein 3)
MLMLYNAVANNGKMMRPYLVNAVRDYGIDVKTIQPKIVVEKICSDETLAQLKECLKAVVDSAHGTAHAVVFDSAYSIAGKTGTAVTALDNTGYNKGNKIYQASFIGYFPSEQPKYTIAVVIQNSRQSKLIYGADVSGKVFKEISDKIYGRYLSTKKFTASSTIDSTQYNYQGWKKEFRAIASVLHLPFTDNSASSNWVAMNIKNKNGVIQSSAVEGKSKVPDVTGLGLKDAVYKLEEAGLKVLFTGRGRVYNQSLIAGTDLKKGQTISLILN